MKTGPFCAEQIQDAAVKCRYCGEFLDGRQASPLAVPGMVGSYEYRSPLELFGLPQLHVAQGVDPDTGLPRVARGIIAVGNIAIGALAVGGLALGGMCFGGLALGVLAIGGLALGGAALGGIALAAALASGVLAVSLQYAFGGLALAPHALGAAGADPDLLHWLGTLCLGLGGGE